MSPGACPPSRGARASPVTAARPRPQKRRAHYHTFPPQKQHLTFRREHWLHKPRRPRARFQRAGWSQGCSAQVSPSRPHRQQPIAPPHATTPSVPPRPESSFYGRIESGPRPRPRQRAPCVLSAALYFLCVRDYCLCQDIRGERRTHRSLLSFFSLCLRHKTAFCSPFFSRLRGLMDRGLGV